MPPLSRMMASIILAGIVTAVMAGTVRTETFFSTVMNDTMSYHVYLRSDYDQRVAAGDRFPVMYLLHGLGSSATMWHRGVVIKGATTTVINPHADWAVDSVNLIIVAVDDGTQMGWWMDSPLKIASKLSTYLATELRDRIDSTLATVNNSRSRGLCGVSMGGYGALHNAMLYPETFSACFGAVPCVVLTNWHDKGLMLEGVLGAYDINPARWVAADVFANVGSCTSKDLRVGFYTKQQDIFRNDNLQLDSAMKALNIAHDFTLYPTGGHDVPNDTFMVMMAKWMSEKLQPAGVVRPARERSAPMASRAFGDPRWGFDLLGRARRFAPGSRMTANPGQRRLAARVELTGVILYGR